MASHLGLQVEIVNGFSKNSEKAKVGRESDHSWNSIKIDDENILLDVTWGAGSEMNNKWVSKTNYYYFNTDPDEFIFKHLPDSINYQFIDAPVSKEEFKKMPYVSNEVFINNLITGKEILKKFRSRIKTSFPSFLSTEIDYKIIKAPIEMNIGVSYDFIIESPNGYELIDYFKNKPIKKVTKDGNTFKFSYKAEKQGQFQYGISNPDLYKNELSIISQYIIK